MDSFPSSLEISSPETEALREHELHIREHQPFPFLFGTAAGDFHRHSPLFATTTFAPG